MLRCKHETFGLGVCLEEFVSGSGLPVARVIFDKQPGTGRIILLSVLSESTAKLPPTAKTAKPARKPRAKRVEPVSDDLLVDLSPKIGIQLDAVDIGEPPEQSEDDDLAA